MRNPLKPSKDCVVCFKKLNKRDLIILKESNFSQSWCEICLLKYIESYPITNGKKDAYYEIERINRKIK